jgi:AcrR family transcriptional regulator
VTDHKERQALHIGRTAMEQASVQGLATVTMSRLAATAGVSRATLYNYFPDVEAAITYYLVAQAKEFHRRLASALEREPTAWRKLECYIEEHIRYVAEDDHRSAAAAMETGVVSPRVSEQLSEHLAGPRSLLAEILDNGRTDGSFSDSLDVDATTALIQSMLHASHDLLVHGGRSIEQTNAAVVRLLDHGVRSAKPGGRPRANRR